MACVDAELLGEAAGRDPVCILVIRRSALPHVLNFLPSGSVQNVNYRGGSNLPQDLDHNMSINRRNLFHIRQSSQGTVPQHGHAYPIP